MIRQQDDYAMKSGWSRERLETLNAERAQRLSAVAEVEKVALAFARWKGLTNEPGIDKAAAKAETDKLLEALDEAPEQWSALKEVAHDLDHRVFKGLITYSLERGQQQLKTMTVELERERENDPTPPDPRKQPLRSPQKGRQR